MNAHECMSIVSSLSYSSYAMTGGCHCEETRPDDSFRDMGWNALLVRQNYLPVSRKLRLLRLARNEGFREVSLGLFFSMSKKFPVFFISIA